MNHRLMFVLSFVLSLGFTSGAAFSEVTKGATKEAAVPANLQFANGETATLRLEAKGVQIYECKNSAQDAAKFEWAFKSPEAELFDTTGKPFGKHYGGPTWESNDGSKVVGEVKTRADSPDAASIPWLLLSAKSILGNGVFSGTKAIQRINTVGGKASGMCGAAEVGKILRVSYTATYVYSK